MNKMNMKRILSAMLLPLAVISCNVLDFDETSGLKTKEDMYRYFNSAESMLTNVYSYMPKDLGTVSGAMRDAACDDAEYGNTSGKIQYFNNGSWSAVNTVDNAWGLYAGIRAANAFIRDIETLDLSRYEYNGQYQNWLKKLAFFP